jgi:DNA polymerase III delta prime subunit
MLENYIWYEKYRPNNLDEMTFSKRNKKIFYKYIADKNIPHLLLSGSAGSGKTTTALILIKELKATKLILNASSEDRGIGTMKGKVKQFASSQSNNLKVVLLDEADHLTSDAQPALRNTIETYSKTCRFILTANYKERIIKPIQSRCTSYEFSTFSKSKVYTLIEKILEKEKIKSKDSDIRIIIEKYYPDIRSIINTIQSCSLSGKLILKELPTLSIDFKKFENLLCKGEIGKLREMWYGISDFTNFYKHLFNTFIPSYKTNEKNKTEMAIEVTNYMYQDALVLDKEINFSGCCISLMQILKIKIRF